MITIPKTTLSSLSIACPKVARAIKAGRKDGKAAEIRIRGRRVAIWLSTQSPWDGWYNKKTDQIFINPVRYRAWGKYMPIVSSMSIHHEVAHACDRTRINKGKWRDYDNDRYYLQPAEFDACLAEVQHVIVPMFGPSIRKILKNVSFLMGDFYGAIRRNPKAMLRLKGRVRTWVSA